MHPPLTTAVVGRRHVLACSLLATSLSQLPLRAATAANAGWGPIAAMSNEELAALDEASKSAEGVLLPSGVRVIDMVPGTGPEPQRGQRVYAAYKVWANGFRSGPVADLSFTDGRPYDWILGEPTDRLPAGADEGVLGMREGGWRRLVIPPDLAYGEMGLKRVSYSPLGRYVGPKAPYVIQPGAAAYFDLIMLDGGSGRCDQLLRPPGVGEKEASKIKSAMCVAAVVERVDVRAGAVHSRRT